MTNSIQPKLRTFDITMIVIGLVIGMGIFRTPPEVAESAKMPLIFFSVWIAGGIVSMIGALTFAEIGSTLPTAGGFYKIFSVCYHPSFAFMVNWITVISNAASTAGVAIMGAEYLSPLVFPEMLHEEAVQILTISSVSFLYLINLIGIKTSSTFLNVLMIIKLGLLALLISSIFILPGNENPDPALSENFSGWKAFLLCFIPVFFTYGGYQQTINFGSDVANPIKSMPRAIIIGMIIVLFFYLLVNYAYYHVLGMEGLAESKTLAADISGLLLGENAFIVISILMYFSVMSYANVSIMSNPRIYYAMAEDKVMPKIFMNVNPKTQVQFYALTFFCVMIILTLFFLTSFQKILEFVMFFDSISLIAAACCIFILRKKRKENNENKIYRMKGYPYLPIVFVVIYFGVILSVFITNPWSALWGFVLFIAGLPLYYLIQKLIKA